ncbi:MAG: class IV adenylate cyclase [Isosphaeraceae bacterium]
MIFIWAFSDPEETAVITLERILRGKSSILLVTHDREDGGWQFLDGEHVFEDDGVAVGLGEIVQFDPSLEELADLPVGWYAWRTAVGQAWQRAEGDAPGASETGSSTLESAATNIEIKAHVPSFERVREAAQAASQTEVEVLDQEDIYYAAPSGRLKLRILGESSGELIHYHRPDAAEPRASHYRIAPTTAPRVLEAILNAVLPVLGTVRKRRLLYRVGRTRIHLDRVDQLGDFVELEVVLGPGQSQEQGIAVAQELMARLGIAPEHLVRQAYIDLLREGSSSWSLPGNDPG